MERSDADAEADATSGVGVMIEVNETKPLSDGVDDVEVSIEDDSADERDGDAVDTSLIDIELDSVEAAVGLTSAEWVPSAATVADEANLGELEPLPLSSPVADIDCVIMEDKDASSVAEIVGEEAKEALADADKMADSDCAAEAALEKLGAALMVGGVGDSDTRAVALPRDGDTLVDAVTPLSVGSELIEFNTEWLVRIVAEGQWVDDDESSSDSEGSRESDAVGEGESAIVLVIVIVTKLEADREGARENE